MARYERLTAAWPQSIEPFPELGDLESIERKINAWFTPYVFYRRKSRGKYMELWTSCCGRHEGVELLQRTMTPQMSEIMFLQHNSSAYCPYCGRKVLVKCLGRGSRRTLTEYHPVVILREQDGDIYARAYWVHKNYECENTLHDPPLFNLVGAYKFGENHARRYAEFYDHCKYRYTELDGVYDPKNKRITEPFVDTASYGFTKYAPYAVLGLEELNKSRFKYCEYASYRMLQSDIWGGERIELHSSLMKYLALSSIYPRQTEMLMKTGWRRIVEDMVDGQRKSAAAFNWNSPTGGATAFGLTKPEYRALINGNCHSVDVVAEYKRMKKAGLCRDINTVMKADRMIVQLSAVRRACIKFSVTMEKLWSYIQKQGTQSGVSRTLHWTLDYWDMAAQLGWDMTDSTVLFPKNIKAKHDTAAEELTIKRAETQAAVICERLSKWRAKYNIEQEGFLIRVAENSQEIVQEGTALKHCVAGYAQRHMDGRCTILFLRRSAAPETPLYTIEMRENQLIQIHGYANEYVQGKRMADPRKTMAWLIDPWLNWIQRGSPRDKDGKPKLNIKREKTA